MNNAFKDGWMPLESYTWVHKNAILTDTEKKITVAWITAVRDSIKMQYHTDSLILRAKK